MGNLHMTMYSGHSSAHGFITHPPSQPDAQCVGNVDFYLSLFKKLIERIKVNIILAHFITIKVWTSNMPQVVHTFRGGLLEGDWLMRVLTSAMH